MPYRYSASSVRQIDFILFPARAQQTLASERGTPCFHQVCKGKSQRISFRKHQEIMVRNQFPSHVSRQFPKESLGAIAANGDPKSLSDNDADPARTCVGLADQQIKTCRGQSPAMLFDILDVSARAKEERLTSSTPRYVWFIE